MSFGSIVNVWDADLIYIFFRTPKYLGAPSLKVMAFWRTSHCKGQVNWLHSGHICECTSIWNKISKSISAPMWMSEMLIWFTFFQDTKVFGGTVPWGHGNDCLLTDLIAKSSVNLRQSGHICKCKNPPKKQKQNQFWPHCECLRRWFDLIFFSGHQSIWGHRPSRSWQWWPFDGPQKAVRRSRGLGRGFWWSNQAAFAKTTSTSSEFGCGVSKIKMAKNESLFRNPRVDHNPVWQTGVGEYFCILHFYRDGAKSQKTKDVPKCWA